MTSLLQLSIDTLQGSTPGDASLVTFHRQCGYAIAFAQPNTFDLFHWQPGKKPAWKPCAVFQAHKLFQKVVAVFSIEAIDCFAFVGATASESILALVDFHGAIRSVYQVSRQPEIICAEFSQKSRELYCSFEGGQLVAYCLLQKADHLQLVRRKALHISVEQVQIPLQIVSLDLVGLILTLTRSGNIICLDAGKLEVVFTVMRHVFSLNPTRLWADPFGTAFAVLCENYTTPSATPRTDQQLEVFIPPTDYATCHAGMFDRCIIPLSGQLCALTLENLGEPVEGLKGTQLATLTSDGRMCLFELQPSSRSMIFLTSLSLNLPPAFTASTTTMLPESHLDDLWIHRSSPGLLRFVPWHRDVGVLCGYMSSVATVKIAVSPLSADPLTRQLLLRRSRKPVVPIQPISAPGRLPVEKGPSPVVMDKIQEVVSAEAIDRVTYSRSPSPIDVRMMVRDEMGERLRTPPLPPTREVKPPEPVVSWMDAASLMTDTLRDESSQLSGGDLLPRTSALPSSSTHAAVSSAPRYAVDWMISERWLASRLPSSKGVMGLVMDGGFLLRGDGQFQVIDEDKGLLPLSTEALLESTGYVSDPTKQIRLCSIAYRAGLLCIVTAMRDCRLYRLSSPPSRPVELAVSLHHHCVLQTLLCADISLVQDASMKTASTNRKTRGTTSTSSSSSSSSSSFSSSPRDYSLTLCGDSEGWVHFFVLDNAKMQCLHSNRFRAHHAPLSTILCTGDANQPQWNISMACDWLGRSPRYCLQACAGSAIVTLSTQGEVKVWQPQTLGDAKASTCHPIALFACDLAWRLAGIFQFGEVATRSDQEGEGEMRVEESRRCLTLAPLCMHILAGDARGRLSLWPIPGIAEMDARESTLSTMQAPVWTDTAIHRGMVTSCRIWVEDPLSQTREVSFPSDRTREEVLQSLAVYARVSARARSTIGFSFPEVKRVRESACMITCAQDFSLVLWAFVRGVDAASHACLHPVPRRRFYFSSPPEQGLVSCLTSTSGWEVYALINGLPHCVLQSASSTAASSAMRVDDWLSPGGEEHQGMIQDTRCRDCLQEKGGLLMRFEDELQPIKPVTPGTALAHQQAILRPQDAVDWIPVVVSIQRPPCLVQCHQVHQMVTSGGSGGAGEGLVSQKFYHQWSQIREGPIPLGEATVLESPERGRKEEEKEDSHFQQAVLSLPPPAALSWPLPVLPQPLPASTLPRPVSPGKVNVHFPEPGRDEGEVEREQGEEAAAAAAAERRPQSPKDTEKVKFQAKGLWLEAPRQDVEITRHVLESGQPGRFVLAKEMTSLPENRVGGLATSPQHVAHSEVSLLPSQEYSLTVGEMSRILPSMASHDHRMEKVSPTHSPSHSPVQTPDHRLYLPQLEDYLSRPTSAAASISEGEREGEGTERVEGKAGGERAEVGKEKKFLSIEAIHIHPPSEDEASHGHGEGSRVLPPGKHRVEKPVRVDAPVAHPQRLTINSLGVVSDLAPAVSLPSQHPPSPLAQPVVVRRSRPAPASTVKYLSKTSVRQVQPPSASAISKRGGGVAGSAAAGGTGGAPASVTLGASAMSLVGPATRAQMESKAPLAKSVTVVSKPSAHPAGNELGGAAAHPPPPLHTVGLELEGPPTAPAEASHKAPVLKTHHLSVASTTSSGRKPVLVLDDEVSVQSKQSIQSEDSLASSQYQPFHPLLSPSRPVVMLAQEVPSQASAAAATPSQAPPPTLIVEAVVHKTQKDGDVSESEAAVSDAAAAPASSSIDASGASSHAASPPPRKIVHKVVLKREDPAPRKPVATGGAASSLPVRTLDMGFGEAALPPVRDQEEEMDGLAEMASTVDLKSTVSSVQPPHPVAVEKPQPPSTRAQPISRVVLPRKKETRKAGSTGAGGGAKPLHAPKQALTLDLPDKRQESRQRHAQIVAKALEDRGALDAVPTPAAEMLRVNDDDSLITSYFDRTAKPIFVDHTKAVTASRHQTRRQGDIEDALAGDNAMDWDGEEGDFQHLGSRPFSHGRGDRLLASGGQTPASRTGKEALYQQLLQSLSEEERRAMENMDEATRERMLRELQTAPTGKAALDPATLKAAAERALDEARDLALVRMDVSLDVLEATDHEVVVTLASYSGGAVLVALTKEHRRLAAETIAEHPSCQSVVVPAQGSQEVRFSGLRPDTAYWIHCVADLSAPTAPRNPSESLRTKPPWTVETLTTPEVLEVDWCGLSPEMQQVELRAAIRSELVQLRAATHQPAIKVPTEEDIGRAEVLEVLSGTRVPLALTKVVFVFLEFWSGPYRSGAASGPGTTTLRKEFLYLEALNACLDKDIATAFSAQGLATVEEMAQLRQYCLRQIQVVNTSIVNGRPIAIDVPVPHTEGFPTAEQAVFFRFRSWYRAGQVLQDVEQQQAQRVQHFLQTHRGEGEGGRGGDSDSESEDRSAENSLSLEDSSMASEIDKQSLRRQTFLEKHIQSVSSAVALVRRLYEGYVYTHQKGLQEKALLLSRGNLTSTDVTAIMCAKKLFSLLHEHNLVTAKDMDKIKDTSQAVMALNSLDPCRPFPLALPRAAASKPVMSMAASMKAAATQAMMTSEEVVLQRIGRVDLFREATAVLTPDDPPPVTITPLPGTNRRPLKPWQLMSPADQRLELALACTLLSIEELAVQDAIEIPEPEDFALSPESFPARHRVCSDFRLWYAGEEERNPVPGLGVPTLARVLFAEQLETRHVEQDPAVLRLMREKKLPLPKGYASPSRTSSGRKKADEGEVGVDEVSEDEEEKKEVEDGNAAPENQLEAFESLLQAYQRAIDTSSGVSLRIELISNVLARVLTSRRLSMAKFLWPPGLNRTSAQYFFPRMGILIPPYSLPSCRLVLFPSRNRESYNIEEVLGWYNPVELDGDDHLMQRAEQQGIKQRAYLEWLSREEERIAEMRVLMVEEDIQSHEQRTTLKYLDSFFQKNVERVQRLDAALDAGEYEGRDADEGLAMALATAGDTQRFRFQEALAREFWYMYEQSVEFKAGSGICNEDEVEDLLLEQQELARKAMEEARELEQYLNEEKKKRDVEESTRQKREEQDRRLKEGLARRRQLREHFEELRRLRSLRQQEEAAALARRLQEEAAEEAARQAEALLAAEQQLEAQRIAYELEQMAAEEAIIRDVRVARLEIRMMEHEDIHSFLVEQLARKWEQQQREHLEELRQIYEPFEPFHFRHSRVRLPVLHTILRDEEEDGGGGREEYDYEEEGEDEDEMEEEEDDETGTSPTDSWEVSRSTTSRRITKTTPKRLTHQSSHAFSQASSHPGPTTPSGTAVAASEGSKTRHRLTDNPPHSSSSSSQPAVRPRDYTLSKSSLRRKRAEKSADKRGESILPFNPYDAQWELMARPQSPALLASSPAAVFTKSPLRSLHSTPPSQQVSLRMGARPYPPIVCTTTTGQAEGKDVSKERLPSREMPPGANASVETIDTAQLGQEQRDALVREVLGDQPLESSLASATELPPGGVRLFEDAPSASLFHSQESTSGGARKRMKQLLTTSAAILERYDQQLFLKEMQAQRALAFASLTTLDKQRVKSKQRLMSRSTPLLDPLVLPGGGTAADTAKEREALEAQLQTQAARRLTEQGLTSLPTSTAQSMLDFKTRKLAASASESVLQMQRDRAALTRYVSGGAIFESGHFLAACEPGLRGSVLQENPIAMRFAQEIEEQLRRQEATSAAGGPAESTGIDDPVVDLPPARKPPTRKSRPKSREAGGDRVLKETSPPPDSGPRLGAIFGSALAVPPLSVEAKREVIQRPTKASSTRVAPARGAQSKAMVMVGSSSLSGGSKALPEMSSGGFGAGGGESAPSSPTGRSRSLLSSHSVHESVDEQKSSTLRTIRSLDLFIQTPRSTLPIAAPDSPHSSTAHSLAYSSVGQASVASRKHTMAHA